MRDRELSSSSDKPSEKYSCSLSPLRFSKGRTAIEWGGGLKAVELAVSSAARGVVAGGELALLFAVPSLSIARYARSTARTAAIRVIAMPLIRGKGRE